MLGGRSVCVHEWVVSETFMGKNNHCQTHSC